MGQVVELAVVSFLLWHWVRNILLISTCVVLVGCGSSQKEEEPRPAPKTAKIDDTRPVIAAFGDSLSAGFGADPGKSYPDFLQKELDARGLRYHIVNAGISGDTSTDGLQRIDSVIALKPVIVILEFGGNDGLRGLPVATTRANLEQMIVALRKSDVTVVLAGMTLPPNYGPDYIKSFETVYRDLAKQYRVALVPFLLEGVGGNTRLMQRDGMHPTAEGNRLVAHNVLRVLLPILERPPASGRP